jgi:hypothetical protein
VRARLRQGSGTRYPEQCSEQGGGPPAGAGAQKSHSLRGQVLLVGQIGEGWEVLRVVERLFLMVFDRC